jgi:hypothetical protein
MFASFCSAASCDVMQPPNISNETATIPNFQLFNSLTFTSPLPINRLAGDTMLQSILGRGQVATILKLLGFWPPLVYGFAVFSLFWLLDRNAAPRARKAISGWFAGPAYDKQGVAAAVLYVFDKFYTSPLLGWRALFRSAAISTAVTVVVSLQVSSAIFWFTIYGPLDIRMGIVSQLITNICADYLALFFIRRWLILGGRRPLPALITAPLIGVLLVAVCYLVRDVGGFALQTLTFEWHYFVDDFYQWSHFIANKSLRWSLLVPAFLVHVWLPLFALGVIIVKALNSVRMAGRFSQWFFVGGDAHPLRSIGYIAGAATSLLTAAILLIR